MNIATIFFLVFLFITFLAGIHFCMFQKCPFIENMENRENQNQNSDASSPDCPDMLIRSGNAILLLNTKLPKSETNPIPFYSLDEYINYLEIQRNKGIHCPVLYLQEETNTQGEDVYRIRPNPFELEGGLPQTTTLYREPSKIMPVIDATDDNPPYNANNYKGFDPMGLQIGVYTDLDKIHNSTSLGNEISDNPMDPNWGGVIYTHEVVESGKYVENEVVPPTQNPMFSEKTDNKIASSRARNIYA